MATIAKIFNNKSGFLLALLLMFFIGTAAVMARTLTDDKKDKAPTKKKVAVVKKTKLVPTYTFYYNGPDFSVDEVTKESNWVYDATDNTCSGDNDQACTIKVNTSFVNNPGTATPTLKTATNLTASLNTTYSSAYVTGSSDGGMLISNAAHP